MSIIVKLDDMLHKRRMTLTELSERIGITLANLSVLKTGKARAVRFSTLDAICAALQCQPGGLLEFAPASPAGVDQAAVAVYLLELACQITMIALLYDLPKPAGRSGSLLAAIFGRQSEVWVG
jgi:putative transcriptional regulator